MSYGQIVRSMPEIAKELPPVLDKVVYLLKTHDINFTSYLQSKYNNGDIKDKIHCVFDLLQLKGEPACTVFLEGLSENGLGDLVSQIKTSKKSLSFRNDSRSDYRLPEEEVRVESIPEEDDRGENVPKVEERGDKLQEVEDTGQQTYEFDDAGDHTTAVEESGQHSPEVADNREQTPDFEDKSKQATDVEAKSEQALEMEDSHDDNSDNTAKRLKALETLTTLHTKKLEEVDGLKRDNARLREENESLNKRLFYLYMQLRFVVKEKDKTILDQKEQISRLEEELVSARTESGVNGMSKENRILEMQKDTKERLIDELDKIKVDKVEGSDHVQTTPRNVRESSTVCVLI